jgi:hypothetical protein
MYGGGGGAVILSRENVDRGGKGQLMAIMRRDGGGRRSARIMRVNVRGTTGSGWRRQGGGGNAKMVCCVFVLSRNLVTEILVTPFVWRFCKTR